MGLQMEQLTNRQVSVEIIAKKKGCVLCDLAIGILEEISSELNGFSLKWKVVDVGDREGLRRYAELIKICGSKPAVPSIVINEKIAFDHIPDYESLYLAVMGASREENRCI
jgi:glutaredoxin